MLINIIKKTVILSGLFILCLASYTILEKHFGITDKLMQIAFFLFAFGTIIYLLQIQNAKD